MLETKLFFKILISLETWQTQESASGGVLCIFGRQTFVPVTWSCKKQTGVSHSSAEAEIISHDAGLRMDGFLALSLWNPVIDV